MSTSRNRAPHALNDARVTLRAGARMAFDGGIFFDGVPALDGLVWSVDPATGLADVEFGDPGTRSAVRGRVAVTDLVVCTERLYHVVILIGEVARAERVRGSVCPWRTVYSAPTKKVYMTRTPVTQQEAATVISKCRRTTSRITVEDAYSAAPITRDGALESEEAETPPAAPFACIVPCAIRNGAVAFDPDVIAHSAPTHVFPFVGTIDIDAIYRDPRWSTEAP